MELKNLLTVSSKFDAKIIGHYDLPLGRVYREWWTILNGRESDMMHRRTFELCRKG